MLPNQKLFVSIAVISVLGFILVLSVLYDSYQQSILNHKIIEQSANLDSIQDLVTQHSNMTEARVDHIINLLDNIYRKNEIYVIKAEHGSVKYIGDPQIINERGFQQLIPTITQEKDAQGYSFFEHSIFTWATLLDRENHILYGLIQKVDNGMLAGFTRDYGVPIFITFLVVGWIMLWAGMILNSLFKKLNDQNLLLENQSQKITEARDAALNSNKAKTFFLANMSHEIRTPLTAIIGFSKSLLESEQSMQERVSAIKTIHNSGKHLLHIVDEILDLSKIEAEKLQVESINVSPVILLNEIFPLMRMQAEGKGLEFRINYEPPIPVNIKTDPTRLKQILLNLVSNAVKFTERGHIHINVSCAIETQTIVFEVVDSGIGMTLPQQEKVFTAFTQADSSTTRKYGGTGLGLTLSRQFATKLGGTLVVDSEIGVGSRMHLKVNTGSLKYAKFYSSEAELPFECESDDVPLRKIALTGTVLLAEDNPANQKLFELYLRSSGATTTTVDNGAQAVDKAMIKKYDLIFMDMQMPVMNGLDAVNELRRNNYKAPIIALTANSTVEDRDACLAAGCDDFISKPVDRNTFIEVLCKYLHESKPDEKDTSAILSSVLQDEPDLFDLVIEFIGKIPIMLEQIKMAYTEDDMERFRSEIHKLKGVGAGYGYAVLTELAGKIEFQVQNNNRHQIELLLADLEDHVHRIVKGKPEIETRYRDNLAQG